VRDGTLRYLLTYLLQTIAIGIESFSEISTTAMYSISNFVSSLFTCPLQI